MMGNNRIGICLLTALSFSSSQASLPGGVRPLVMVQAPSISRGEFTESLRDLDESARSYTDVALEKVEENKLNQLNQLLAEAQSRFLNGTLDEAREAYSQIAAIALISDWPNEQRQAIHYSFLRLAQLESDSERRDLHLREAAAFAPDLEPDRNLFSPPLVAQYQKVTEEQKGKAVTINLADRFSGFDWLIHNGRRIRIAKTENLKLPPGTHRLKLLSNLLQDQTVVVDAFAVSGLEPIRRYWLSGTCQNPLLNFTTSREVPLPTGGVFARDCIVTKVDGVWKNLAKKSVEFTQRPITSSSNDIPMIHAPQPMPVAPTKSTKRGWLWAGLAGVAAASVAVMLAENQKSQRSSGSSTRPPSNTEGY